MNKVEHMLTIDKYCSVILSDVVIKPLNNSLNSTELHDRIFAKEHGPSYFMPSFGMRKLNKCSETGQPNLTTFGQP